MSARGEAKSVSLSELPHDELLSYGRGLGLALDDRTPEGELLRLIRERQELLLELDRDAMLDVVVWARRPVRESAGKEELAGRIAPISRGNFAGLSHRGLVVLARLRGLEVSAESERGAIEAALKRADGVWGRIMRRRRSVVGSFLANVVCHGATGRAAEYRFLPEETGDSIKTHIEEEGMVGGIARKLRGVADDYVHEKLDEIEARIDRKLDEIDKRLGEWRDREVSNRLKILKITLIVSIIVALLGLGYDALRWDLRRPASPQADDRGSETRAGDGVHSPYEHRGDVRTTEQPR